MNYLRSADLGFNKDQQIVIPLRSENAKKMYGSFRDELLKQAGIANVGASLYYPGISNPSDNIFFADGKDMQQGKDVKMNYIDTRYLQSLNIQPLAGRLYSEAYYREDTTGTLVLNETAIKAFGFKSASLAVNQKLHFTFNDSTYIFNIIGVVKDFHYEDLHLPIGPYGFQLNTPPLFNYMIVHIQSADVNAALLAIGNTWHNLNATEPFDYSFLDKDFQKNFRN